MSDAPFEVMAAVKGIKKAIQDNERLYGRPIGATRLIAVSKKQPLYKLQQAIEAGQLVFAESYLQEALPKIAALSHYPIEWHFIGPIQQNKVKRIAEYFDWVQSVASLRVAERLNQYRPKEKGPLSICIQVNISNEASKSGINQANLVEFATACSNLPRLKLRGLMAIPASKDDFTMQRLQFRQLKDHFDTLRKLNFKLDTLSMGMSQDFAAAIAEGSTMVRIGSAIFGSR